MDGECRWHKTGQSRVVGAPGSQLGPWTVTAMRHVGEHIRFQVGDRINLVTNTVCFSIRLADAVGELPYFPEENMHRKKYTAPHP